MDGDGEDLVGAFKDALYSEVEQGPARLEFERRRLLARLSSGRSRSEGRPRSRSLVLGLAAACAAAAAVVVVLAVLPDAAEPGAESITLSGLWRVRSGDAIARGTPLRVPAGAGAKLVLEDGTALWLGPGAELAALDDEVSTVRLDAGRLLASVARRPEWAPFKVATPLAEVTVHGTVFSVVTDPGRTKVRLHEGEISLGLGDESIDVEPGHEVAVATGGEVSLGPIDAVGVLTDLLVAEKTVGLAGPLVPELEAPVAEIEQVVDAVVDDQPPPAQAEDEGGGAPRPKRQPASVRTPSRSAPAAADPRHPDPAPPAAADPELAAIEVEAAPAPGVIDQLRELIAQERFADAIGVADAYLAEQPRGAHADDVLYLRAHCQARTGDLRGGRQSLKDYLTRFPEGRYWDRVRDILGE